MHRITTHTLSKYKKQGQRFAAITVYDALFAQVLEDQGIDVFLVGDSVGMVFQGFESTVQVTLETLIYPQCVARGKSDVYVADMPFMTCLTTL